MSYSKQLLRRFFFSFRRKFTASKASETSKGRVKLRAWLSPLKQGHNLVLKASLLNTSLKYSFSLSSCILLFKENLKAKRELRRRLSGKSNKGLNSLCFHPQFLRSGTEHHRLIPTVSSADPGQGGRGEEEEVCLVLQARHAAGAEQANT